MSALHFDALLTTRDFEAGMARIRADIRSASGVAQRESTAMDNSFKKLGLGIGTYFSGAALGSFANQVIKVRGEFQKTQIAFETMLGSADKAEALMGQMVNLAAKTPFSLQDVSSGAKQLLAFQVPAEEVVDTLTRLGNIAAGLSIPLERINLVYGQVKSKGKLDGGDLKQFTEAGIPMITELSKKLGVATADIYKMVSAGTIGFKDVQDVLFGLTNEGGMFFNLMEKQSESLSGKLSNLEDAFDQMLNKIGASSEGVLGGVIDSTAFLLDNYESVLTIIETLIVSYGAYKAALIATAAVQNISAAMAVQQAVAQGTLSTAQAFGAAVSIQFQLAQKALNATMLANPYVAVAAAILGLVYMMYKLRDTTTEVERVNRKVSETLNTIKTAQDNLKKSSDDLIGVIKSEHATQTQKYEAYLKLQTLYPNYLKNISMENFLKMETVEINKLLASAQEKYGNNMLNGQIKSAEEKIKRLKEEAKILNQSASQVSIMGDKMGGGGGAYIANAQKKQKDLDSEIGKLNKLKFIQQERNEKDKIAGYSAQQRLKYYEKEVKSLESQLYQHRQKNKNLKESDQLTIKLASGFARLSLGGINAQIARMNAGLSEAESQLSQINKTAGQKTKGDWEATRDAFQGELDKLTKSEADGAKGKGIKAKIAEAEKALKSWDVAKEKSSEKDKVYAKGSVGWIDAQISKLQELQKNTKFGSALFNKYEAQIKSLEKQRGDKNRADENTPLKGSLGALEKQLSDVQDKLQNKTLISDEKTRNTLLNKQKELQEKIAEIKKDYSQKTFDEELAELERQWNVRYMLAKTYSEDIAKAQFPDLKGNSYFDDIQARYKELDEKINSNGGKGVTDEELSQWEKLKKIISTLTGEKTTLENFKDGLDKELSNLTTSAEKIQKLEEIKKNLTGQEKDAGALAEINRQIDSEINAQEQKFKSILQEQQTYQEKSDALTKDWESMKESKEYKSSSPEEKDKIKKSFNSKQTALDNDAIEQMKIYQVALGDLENISNSSLQSIINGLEAFKDANKDNLTTESIDRINEAIDRVKNTQGNNPFQNIIGGYQSLKKANEDVKTATENYNKALDSGDTKAQEQAEVELTKALQKQKEKRDELGGQLQKGQDIFNAIGNGVKQLGEAFGGFDEATQEAITNIMDIGNAAFDLGKSIASGDVAGMIKSGIQLIASIGKAISGDNRKERNIKQWAEAVKGLERAYNQLQRAIDKALGDKYFDASKQAIQNLQRQRELLQKMIREEASKKDSDQSKIDSFKDQIQSIDNAIEDMIGKMADKVLNGVDAKSLADQIGDALVSAFERGESGAEAMGKTVDKILRDMAINALKMQILQPAMDKVVKQMLNAMGFTDSANQSQIDGLNAQLQQLQQEYNNATGINGVFQRARLQKQMDAIRNQINALMSGNFAGTFDGLTAQEILDIKNNPDLQNAINAFQQGIGSLSDIFGDLGGEVQGLKGDIKGISEKTAGALESQVNAIRTIEVELFNLHKSNQSIFTQSLQNLVAIEFNTRRLHNIDKNIQELNEKTKKGLAGVP